MKAPFFLILGLLASASAVRQRPVDACALLTRPEIESLFGSLKTAPKSDEGLRHERECRYQNLDGQWLESSLYSADRWGLEKGIVSEQHPTPVIALGDEAFSVKVGADSRVYVRIGNEILEMSCSCGLSKTTALATIAVKRVNR